MTVATNSAGLEPGGTVTVTVTCSVDLGDALLPGVPGTTTLTAEATEPIDAWRSDALGFGNSEVLSGGNSRVGGTW